MKEIPRFASEDEERHFWATHDSIGFLEGAEQVSLKKEKSKTKIRRARRMIREKEEEHALSKRK